jgi:ketosteroid isomerase-like protein
MRKHPILIVTLTALMATGCADSRASSLDDEWERLHQRQEAFLAALSARDADRTADMFSEDAVVHVAGMSPIQGEGAIRQFYGHVFGFLSETSSAPEATHLSGGGGMAYSFGRTSNEFRDPGGAVGYSGKYLLVWQKIAGDWKIVAYSISSNQPDDAR